MKSKQPKSTRLHFMEVMSGIGNRNILSSHIRALSEKLDSENHPFNIEQDTDYFCWLMLKSNYISLSVEHKYLRHNKEISPDNPTKVETMLTFLKSNEHCNKNDIQYLRQVLELRNRLAHLGLPNTIKEIENKNFMNDAVNGEYRKVKDSFQKAESVLSAIPDPTVPIEKLGQIGI